MITIVIPTMWEYRPFVDFIPELCEHPLISKLIIIDNNFEKLPHIVPHNKLEHICFGHNIGVNPAWNLGVTMSETEHICLLNDDVLFDMRLFRKVLSMSNPDPGVIGLCPGNDAFQQPKVTDGSILIKGWAGEHTYGFGCLMFVRRSTWTPIPAKLKIYYGDDWIFNTNITKGKQNYIITNMFHYTPFAVTTGKLPDIDSSHAKEKPIYDYNMLQFLKGYSCLSLV